MLPSLVPTSDIRSMFHFIRSGNIAALFFFDDSVLGRVRDASQFSSTTNATKKSGTKSPHHASSVPESLFAARHLWPIINNNDNNDHHNDTNATSKEANPNKRLLSAPDLLDDEEIELFLLISDHVQISRAQARTRANSILTLHDRNRDTNLFTDNYSAANRVGGEDGMRLLLSTISPKNLHRFGVFGSLIESNQMIARFNSGQLSRATFGNTSSNNSENGSSSVNKVPSESGIMMDDSSLNFDYQGSNSTSSASHQSKSRLSGGQNSSTGTTSQDSKPSFFLGAYLEELRENAIEAVGSDVFIHHISAMMRRVQSVISNSTTATKKASSKNFTAAEQYDFISSTTGTSSSLEEEIFNISSAQRFRTFSLFFEAGFSFLLLGSARLATGYLSRAASIISVMLRGSNPPSLLERLRALLCLSFAKFFSGFALQRCGYGTEASQELRKARYLLFDADAMCRAMMRSYVSKLDFVEQQELKQQQQQNNNSEDSVVGSRSVSMMKSSNHTTSSPGTTKGGASRFLSKELNDLEMSRFSKLTTNTSSSSGKKSRSIIPADNNNKEENNNHENQDQNEENDDSENNNNKKHTSSSAQTLDEICGNEQGYRALSHIRKVTRSFIRHCMLHEGHAVSSTIVSPLLFHVSSSVNSSPVLGGGSGNENDVENNTTNNNDNNNHNNNNILIDNTSWPAKQQLEICLRSLKVLDEIKDATFDINNRNSAASSGSMNNNNTFLPQTTTSDHQDQKRSVAFTTTANNKRNNNSSKNINNTGDRDILLLAETGLSLLLAVCFSPDISATKEHLRISSVSARRFLSRGVEVSTELIKTCKEALSEMFPKATTSSSSNQKNENNNNSSSASAADDLDAASPWLAQRPMLRPGVLIGSLLRHAFLLRAIFHSLRLLWAEAASDLSVLVTQIEVAQEPVPSHIYGTLKLVNTALMQQRDSVHLVRTTKDVLPPVLPVENSRLSSENDVLHKLLPVIEVLRQTLLDSAAARATVEVNFFSNGVVAERAGWKSFLENNLGVIVADGFRLDDYAASQSIRTSHSFDPVRVQDIIEARKTARLTVTSSDNHHFTNKDSSSTSNISNSNNNSNSTTNDHKFLLPPFPFSTTLRCDVTGEVIPLQLDAPDSSLVLFYHCKTCGLRLAPSSMNISYSPEITNLLSHSNNNTRATPEKGKRRSPSPSSTSNAIVDIESDSKYQYSKSTTVMQKKRLEEEEAERQRKLDEAALQQADSKNPLSQLRRSSKNDNEKKKDINSSNKRNNDSNDQQQLLEKRVCVGKLTAAVLCHVGSIVRHCVSVAAASNTRFTLADILEIKNDEDVEKVIQKTKRASSVLHNHKRINPRNSSSQNASQFAQKWESDWKVGRMTAWDPVTFLNFECASSPQQDPLVSRVLSETYAFTANNAYEHLLWNPTSGSHPEGEPVVWVMPPDSFDRANNSKSESLDRNNNNNFAFSDIGLTLNKHMESGNADCVLTANAFEVIRDRVEDPSSDHIHRMVRARTTKNSANGAIKQSCCVVCGKSLLYTTNEILLKQQENQQQQQQQEESSLQQQRSPSSASVRASGSGVSAVLALAAASTPSKLTPSNNDLSQPQKILSKDDYLRQRRSLTAVVPKPKESSSSLSLLSSSLLTPSKEQQNRHHQNNQEQQQNDEQEKTEEEATPLSMKVNALRTESSSNLLVTVNSSSERELQTSNNNNNNNDDVAIFFFRCVICGAVVHKDCGFEHQEKCSTYHIHSHYQQDSGKGLADQRITLHSSENEAKEQHQSRLMNNSSITTRKSSTSFHQNNLEGTTTTTIFTTTTDNTTNTNDNDNNNTKHPLRIVNEYFDIDSLNALKQDYDRMETAETAAQRSGDTLRKWVESDQRAQNDSLYGNNSFSGSGKRKRASIFSASMSNAAFFNEESEAELLKELSSIVSNPVVHSTNNNNNTNNNVVRCDSVASSDTMMTTTNNNAGTARKLSVSSGMNLNTSPSRERSGSRFSVSGRPTASANNRNSPPPAGRRRSTLIGFSEETNDDNQNNQNQKEILPDAEKYPNSMSSAVSFVHTDSSLDEVSLRVIFNEHCEKRTQRISVAAIDEICAHVGLTGGHLIELVARKTGGAVGKQIAEVQKRGLPVFSETMRKKMLAPLTSSGSSASMLQQQQQQNNNGNNNSVEQLQGLTTVHGSLNFDEFCLLMSLIPQG